MKFYYDVAHSMALLRPHVGQYLSEKLFKAASKGDLKAVQYYIAVGASPHKELEHPPLTFANACTKFSSYFHGFHPVQVLATIMCCCFLPYKNVKNIALSPISIAASKGYLEVVETLLQADPIIYHQFKGLSPVRAAKLAGKNSLSEFLIQAIDQESTAEDSTLPGYEDLLPQYSVLG